jgi:hypothetical protein
VTGVPGPSLHSSGRIRVWVCSLFAFIEIGAMPWGLDILVLSCRHRRVPASPFAGAPWRRLELEVGSDEILHNKGAGSPDRGDVVAALPILGRRGRGEDEAHRSTFGLCSFAEREDVETALIFSSTSSCPSPANRRFTTDFYG